MSSELTIIHLRKMQEGKNWCDYEKHFDCVMEG